MLAPVRLDRAAGQRPRDSSGGRRQRRPPPHQHRRRLAVRPRPPRFSLAARPAAGHLPDLFSEPPRPRLPLGLHPSVASGDRHRPLRPPLSGPLLRQPGSSPLRDRPAERSGESALEELPREALLPSPELSGRPLHRPREARPRPPLPLVALWRPLRPPPPASLERARHPRPGPAGSRSEAVGGQQRAQLRGHRPALSVPRTLLAAPAAPRPSSEEARPPRPLEEALPSGVAAAGGPHPVPSAGEGSRLGPPAAAAVEGRLAGACRLQARAPTRSDPAGAEASAPLSSSSSSRTHSGLCRPAPRESTPSVPRPLSLRPSEVRRRSRAALRSAADSPPEASVPRSSSSRYRCPSERPREYQHSGAG